MFAADKTPSPAQTLSILLKPLGESDFEAFFSPPPPRDIFSFFFKASASSLLTSRPPAAYANIEKSEARTRPSATALTTIPLEGRVKFTTV